MKKILLYGITTDLEEMTELLESFDSEVHYIKNEELHQELIAVLESDSSQLIEELKYPMSLCLFAGFSKDEIYQVTGKMTEYKMKKPVFATVTQNNIHWKIGKIMTDVNQEHYEMTRNRHR